MNDAPARVLAVDYGDRRTGLAATDTGGRVITPLPALVGLRQPECVAAIAALAAERDCQQIVVGLPLDGQGRRGERAQRTLAFAGRLRAVAPCAVCAFDERWSTDEAHARLAAGGVRAARRGALVDSVAAQIILERWLAEQNG